MNSPDKISAKSSLDEILVYARIFKASDVHLTVGGHIIFRVFGKLSKVSSDVMTQEDMVRLVKDAVPPENYNHFSKTGDLEYVHVVDGHGRFRMTLMKQRQGWELTAHLIPLEIPKFATSGLPESCVGLTKWAQGMVLVTGPANCGKTTTMATLVELINESRCEHIITIEQPVEIVYTPKKCQITQREVGLHTLSQANALRAALREDPDVLVVSELRDLETIQLAVSAAETGHLVFGTMNTVNAVQTLSRLIDSFPSDEQTIVRNMISESLRGIICQQLIPKKDGAGLIAAHEILVVNYPVASLIRDNRYPQIVNTMTTGKNAGMVLMDVSLQNLANSGLIAKEDAVSRAVHAANMQLTG